MLRAWPLPLDEAGDKHTRGTVLVLAGSAHTAGAAILAGVAALRMGAGRLQIATEASIVPSVSVAVPESMVIPLPAETERERPASDLDSALSGCDAVLIGPGLFGERVITDLIERAIHLLRPEAVIVLDAAALMSVANIDATRLARVSGRLVLTPNRQELRTLAHDCSMNGDDELGVLVSTRTGAVVSSFGTVTAADGRRWSAEPSTPGLGTSGSGDVLAGLVAGAAARCGDAAQATCWATFVHGDAGTRLSARLGRTSFIARELLDEVPSVLLELE